MCIITDRYLLILFVLGHGLVTAPRPHPSMVSDQKYLFDCEYTRRLGGPRAGSCGPRTLRHEEISIKIFSKKLSSIIEPVQCLLILIHCGYLTFQNNSIQDSYRCYSYCCLLTVVSRPGLKSFRGKTSRTRIHWIIYTTGLEF